MDFSLLNTSTFLYPSYVYSSGLVAYIFQELGPVKLGLKSGSLLFVL